MGKFCVYTYSGSDGVVFYVGKGSLAHSRHTQHLYRATNVRLKRRLAKMDRAGEKPTIQIVARFDNEAEAFAAEVALIAQIGRIKDGGTLYNQTDGGEGASGAVRSQKERERLRDDWTKVSEKVNTGRAASWADDDLRAKRVASIREALSNPEVKVRQGQAISAALTNPETKKRISGNLKATLATPPQKKKRSVIAIARWSDPEFKASTSAKISAGHNKWEIIADGQTFGSAREAGAALGVIADTVTLRCRRGIYERRLKAEFTASG